MEFACGLYDVSTGDNWVIALEEGMPDLILDGKLYTSKEIVDLDTREITPHAQSILDWPEQYCYHFGNRWVNSPDGREMCCVEDGPDEIPALYVYDVSSRVIKGYFPVPEVLGNDSLYPIQPGKPPKYVDAHTVGLADYTDSGHWVAAFYDIDKLPLQSMPQ